MRALVAAMRAASGSSPGLMESLSLLIWWLVILLYYKKVHAYLLMCVLSHRIICKLMKQY